MLDEGEEGEEARGESSNGGDRTARRRLNTQDRSADQPDNCRTRNLEPIIQVVEPARAPRNEIIHINHVDEVEELVEEVRVNPPNEAVRIEARSPSHFRLDLSPNLNRPDHIYERLEEPSTSASSSTAPTHWRFKMFKSGSKNSKNSQRDGVSKGKNNMSFGEYDASKSSGKMTEKCFPTKSKNKMKISPVVCNGAEPSNLNGGSPISLNVCFGKKLLRSPSNSQTLEFNDRSRERQEATAAAAASGTATCPRSIPAPANLSGAQCVYGRLGNTYGRLHVLGSGIGRIERHLSSSCGNIDHYCALHTRAPLPAPAHSADGNPRFRIENQAVEADRIYQNADNVLEEVNQPVAGPSVPPVAPPGIKGISKGSLQWLMVNRWLPLWVANSGGKNEYKVIDLDFSIYDDVQYPMCTAACNDEHCYGRNMFETCSLYRRNYLPSGNLSLLRQRQRQREEDVQNYNIAQEIANSPGSSFHVRADINEPEDKPMTSRSVDCDSPEPDGTSSFSANRGNSLSAQDSIGENEQDLSIDQDNEASVSECCDPASTSSDTYSPSSLAAGPLSGASSPGDSQPADGALDPQPSTSK